jgi:hypothetical protein
MLANEIHDRRQQLGGVLRICRGVDLPGVALGRNIGFWVQFPPALLHHLVEQRYPQIPLAREELSILLRTSGESAAIRSTASCRLPAWSGSIETDDVTLLKIASIFIRRIPQDICEIVALAVGL